MPWSPGQRQQHLDQDVSHGLKLPVQLAHLHVHLQSKQRCTCLRSAITCATNCAFSALSLASRSVSRRTDICVKQMERG